MKSGSCYKANERTTKDHVENSEKDSECLSLIQAKQLCFDMMISYLAKSVGEPPPKDKSL